MAGSTCREAESGALVVDDDDDDGDEEEGERVFFFLSLLLTPLLLFPSGVEEGERTASTSLRAIPWRLWLGETATRETCSEQPLRKAKR